MPFYLKLPLNLFLICYQILLANAGQSCYNPDMVVPEKPYYVCNTTSEHSACCGPGDPCTTNGYCHGAAGYLYRGGCTDITWQSLNCCPACRDSATNSFSNVYSCPVKNGSFALSWCCGATEGSQQARDGCCNGPLFTPDFGFAIAEIGVLETECNTTDTSSSSELTASSSSNSAAPSRSLATQWTSSNVALASTADRSPNPTPSSKETAAIATGVGLAVEPSSKPVAPSEKGVAIGAGVGVPVGLLLLSGLVLLFLRERRQRVQAQKVANDAHTIAAERGTTGVQGYELYGQSLPQELPHAQVGPEELSSW